MWKQSVLENFLGAYSWIWITQDQKFFCPNNIYIMKGTLMLFVYLEIKSSESFYLVLC